MVSIFLFQNTFGDDRRGPRGRSRIDIGVSSQIYRIFIAAKCFCKSASHPDCRRVALPSSYDSR